MGITAIIAIACGAGLGALLRYWLGMLFNPIFPTLPIGTLAANLLGGLLMGVALGAFAHYRTLPAEVQLMIGTGFLGGLTTFSTFSAEATTLLLRQQYMWFAGHVAVHVIGSITMTIVGLTLIRTLLRA
ncbi:MULTISPECIES: fluoride efflux transporter CrcB [Oleiagrimonas]|jgi:fluoride exporter|uniref:Fluoride-specific ion channel FluC n=1 Tax=Oleiagrimonas citrea TaxID=1665687 RepID=A0A846ZJL6_9GAMM|nr:MULTISPECIES: fluoride efflux transporter CrcB [Oleiagrimonas]NKZ37897.1 fluoride efflux transporter CrcB [Oleiagrimonas citrea]RAP57400.1 fluoride ion transporter CrcB [Oleiagrimonas sp. MCCC 1A03011]